MNLFAAVYVLLPILVTVALMLWHGAAPTFVPCGDGYVDANAPQALSVRLDTVREYASIMVERSSLAYAALTARLTVRVAGLPSYRASVAAMAILQ